MPTASGSRTHKLSEQLVEYITLFRPPVQCSVWLTKRTEINWACSTCGSYKRWKLVNLLGNGRRWEESLQKQMRKRELELSRFTPQLLVRSCDDELSDSGNFLSQFNDSDLLTETRTVDTAALLLRFTWTANMCTCFSIDVFLDYSEIFNLLRHRFLNKFINTCNL